MGMHKSVFEGMKHLQTTELKNRYNLSKSKKISLNVKKKIGITQEQIMTLLESISA